MTNSELIKKAKEYLGCNGKRFCKAYGFSYVTYWCCIFIWYIFRMMKSKLFYDGGKVCNCRVAWQWCKTNLKHVKMADAKPGDIIFFTWSGKGYNKGNGALSIDHIGLIEREGTSSVAHTLEGNTGSVYPTKSHVMKRDRAACYVLGIYRPKYSSKKKPVKKAEKKTKSKANGSSTAKGKYIVVAAKGMNIREKATAKSKRVGGIAYGKTFKAIKKDGNWLYGSAGNIKGWVCLKNRNGKVYLKKSN